MKKHIPNSITLLNLFSGCFAILLATQGYLKEAAAMVLVASVFDFFDGMVARLLHVKSNTGKELDSILAQCVETRYAQSLLRSFRRASFRSGL